MTFRRGFLLGVLLAAAPAFAAVISVEVIGPFDLYKGSTKIATFPTDAACRAGATQQPLGKYSCKNTVAITTKAAPTPPPPPDMHGGIHVDQGSLAPRRPGVTVDLLVPTTDLGHPSDIGQFRTVCDFSHASWDDPIVYPGRPGAAHLHAFFGNDSTDAFSTLATLRQGASNCRGGTVNQSAYWQPAVVDAPTARMIAPQNTIVYYKNGYKVGPPFAPIPEGLKMIAGDPTATTDRGGWPASFVCLDPTTGQGPHGGAIPACPAGYAIWASVEFPQCWNGKDLDAPDHRAHMAYPEQLQQPPFTWRCPATHPVALPVITMNAAYLVRPGDDTTKWRLASDMYDPKQPGGFSLHADYFGGWKPEIIKVWTEKCSNAIVDCGASALGDGRAMQEFGGN